MFRSSANAVGRCFLDQSSVAGERSSSSYGVIYADEDSYPSDRVTGGRKASSNCGAKGIQHRAAHVTMALRFRNATVVTQIRKEGGTDEFSDAG